MNAGARLAFSCPCCCRRDLIMIVSIPAEPHAICRISKNAHEAICPDPASYEEFKEGYKEAFSKSVSFHCQGGPWKSNRKWNWNLNRSPHIHPKFRLESINLECVRFFFCATCLRGNLSKTGAPRSNWDVRQRHRRSRDEVSCARRLQ